VKRGTTSQQENEFLVELVNSVALRSSQDDLATSTSTAFFLYVSGRYKTVVDATDDWPL
jgi:hypothetical protein